VGNPPGYDPFAANGEIPAYQRRQSSRNASPPSAKNRFRSVGRFKTNTAAAHHLLTTAAISSTMEGNQGSRSDHGRAIGGITSSGVNGSRWHHLVSTGYVDYNSNTSGGVRISFPQLPPANPSTKKLRKNPPNYKTRTVMSRRKKKRHCSRQGLRLRPVTDAVTNASTTEI